MTDEQKQALSPQIDAVLSNVWVATRKDKLDAALTLLIDAALALGREFFEPYRRMVRHTCEIHDFSWAHERICREAGCAGVCPDCLAERTTPTEAERETHREV